MRSIKLTVVLALASAGCSAPFTYPDLAKAKDTYAHAVKTGQPEEYKKEFDEAKKAYEKALQLEPKNLMIRQNYDLFKEINDRTKRRSGK